MIKVSKHIYVHPLTIVLFVSSYITRTLEMMSLLYGIMLVHELSHAAAAYFLRLGISKIILYPFGVSLTLKTRILCSFSDKIILYLFGPLINATVAVVMLFLGKYSDVYYNNLAVFILNLLPILPFDGGKLLEEFIIYKKGEKYSGIFMFCISAVFSILLIVILIIFAVPTVNTVSFTIFILGNVLLQKPKYSREYLKQLAISTPKKNKARLLIVDENEAKQKLISKLSMSERTLVVFCDIKGSIKAIKTDKEIIDNILSD